jgi:hypothetical protein
MDAAKNFRILAEREIAELIGEDRGDNEPSSSQRGGLVSHSLWRRPVLEDTSGSVDAPYWGTWGTA